MRIAYPVEYYEGKLKNIYGKDYEIMPITEWHGLRTLVRIFCCSHKSFRKVSLKKIFNGKKSTRPCRECYLEELTDRKEGTD
jgi:hypothetical protein